MKKSSKNIKIPDYLKPHQYKTEAKAKARAYARYQERTWKGWDDSGESSSVKVGRVVNGEVVFND